MVQWRFHCLKQSEYQKVTILQLPEATTTFYALLNNSKGLLKNPSFNLLIYANIPFLVLRAESPNKFSPTATPWVEIYVRSPTAL